MIKQCPSCNRTYSDENISFCLADGALLSAPFDSARDQAPPTQVMPPTTRPAVPLTQPAKPAVSTITRMPEYRPVTLADAGDAPKRRTGLIWVVIAVGALSLLGIGLLVSSAFRDNKESVATAQISPSPPINGAPTPGVSPNADPNLQSVPTSTSPTLQNSSPAELATPTPSTGTGFEQIFTGSEVDQKIRITSKPDPSYTEEARKERTQGRVVLRAVFSSGGQVTNIRAVSGLPNGLTERAMTAAKQIKFVPATKDGRPVSMWMELQYNFNLY